MMQGFESAVVTVECGECGTKNKETAARLQTNPELRCSDCASEIVVDFEELECALAQFASAYQALRTRDYLEQRRHLESMPILVMH